MRSGHVAALRGAVFTDRAKNCDEFNLGTGTRDVAGWANELMFGLGCATVSVVASTKRSELDGGTRSGRGNSVYEMIRAVEKASGRRVPYKYVGRPQLPSGDFGASISMT